MNLRSFAIALLICLCPIMQLMSNYSTFRMKNKTEKNGTFGYGSHYEVLIFTAVIALFKSYQWRELGDDSLHTLTGGGYVISPANQGKQSVVKHMLAIDWKFWKSYLQPSSARSITIRMLGRVAGSFQLDGTSYVCFISMISSYK
jgi:hypothetical protein